MRRQKKISLLHALFREQLSSLVYFILIFVIYLIIFYWSTLSILIESLKYLVPLVSVGGVIVIINIVRAWMIYRGR